MPQCASPQMPTAPVAQLPSQSADAAQDVSMPQSASPLMPTAPVVQLPTQPAQMAVRPPKRASSLPPLTTRAPKQRVTARPASVPNQASSSRGRKRICTPRASPCATPRDVASDCSDTDWPAKIAMLKHHQSSLIMPDDQVYFDMLEAQIQDARCKSQSRDEITRAEST